MKRFDTSKRRLITLIVLATSLVTNPAVAGLFGPDIELLSPGEINTRLHEETVLFSPSGTPLQIKTKGAAVGGFLVGMILSSAMASSGGGGATNAAQLNQQMQANMAIAQQTNASIQGVVNDVAANVTGQQSPELAKLGPFPFVARTLGHAMDAQQITRVNKAGDPVPSLKLSLTQKEWKLDFSMLSSDYTLSSELMMELLDTRTNKIYLRQSCIREYPKKQPLEAWELDEYQAVTQAAEAIAQQCQEEFATALNLPLVVAQTGDTTQKADAEEARSSADEVLVEAAP